jgi:Fic family protein
MLSFKPSPKLEKELKRFQGICIKTALSLEDMAPDEAHYLNRFALISNVGASTRIENAILTDREIEWLDTTLSADPSQSAFEEKKSFILDRLSKDRERSIEEVAGCRQVLQTIYLQTKELSPLTETMIRGLHHELLRYYPPAQKHAGGYKTVSNQVISFNHDTGEKRTVLDPAPPGILTEMAMAELVQWYRQSIHEDVWPLLVATEFVFRFLAIHPFEDGNGRLGRALFLLILSQTDDQYLTALMPFLALDRHIEQNRMLYYSVLRQGSEGKFQADAREYKLEPMAWFFIKIFQEALGDLDLYRRRYAALRQFSEKTLAVLECFKTSPEKRLPIREIERATRLPRRTIQYALRILSDRQFIQRLGKGAASRYQLIF